MALRGSPFVRSPSSAATPSPPPHSTTRTGAPSTPTANTPGQPRTPTRTPSRSLPRPPFGSGGGSGAAGWGGGAAAATGAAGGSASATAPPAVSLASSTPTRTAGPARDLSTSSSRAKVSSTPPARRPSVTHTPAAPRASTSSAGDPDESTHSPSPNRRKMQVCHICGREYGSASLPIHTPKCLQRWEQENAKLPKHLQRPPPTPLAALAGEDDADVAWRSSQKSLVPCPFCGRRFAPDRLVIHDRVCTNKPKGVSIMDEPSGPAQRPRMKVCYICGREYGSASLPIHIPNCMDRFQRENELLPPNLRRALPSAPDHELTVEESNEMAWKMSQALLVPCELCGRTFLPDRLEVHLRSCRKNAVPRPATRQQSLVGGLAAMSLETPLRPAASAATAGQAALDRRRTVHFGDLPSSSSNRDAVPPSTPSGAARPSGRRASVTLSSLPAPAQSSSSPPRDAAAPPAARALSPIPPPSAGSNAVRTCPDCGVDNSANFCDQCGQRLSGPWRVVPT